MGEVTGGTCGVATDTRVSALGRSRPQLCQTQQLRLLSSEHRNKLYFYSAYCDGLEIFQSTLYKMNTEMNNEMKVIFDVFNMNNRKWVCVDGMLYGQGSAELCLRTGIYSVFI